VRLPATLTEATWPPDAHSTATSPPPPCCALCPRPAQAERRLAVRIGLQVVEIEVPLCGSHQATWRAERGVRRMPLAGRRR